MDSAESLVQQNRQHHREKVGNARVGRVVRLPLHISMHHACDTTDVAAAAAAATDDDDDDDGRGDTNMK